MTLDASGIVATIPWTLLLQDLPAEYSEGQRIRALGTFFIPRDRLLALSGVIEQTMHATGWTSLQWRTVPVSSGRFDRDRRQSMPSIVQLAGIAEGTLASARRGLHKTRAYLETHATRHQARGFAVVSLSTQTVIYKGLLSPAELRIFYEDLRDPAFGKPLALLHRKISAAASPLWALAPPLHTLAHNGELRQDAASCW